MGHSGDIPRLKIIPLLFGTKIKAELLMQVNEEMIGRAVCPDGGVWKGKGAVAE